MNKILFLSAFAGASVAFGTSPVHAARPALRDPDDVGTTTTDIDRRRAALVKRQRKAAKRLRDRQRAGA